MKRKIRPHAYLDTDIVQGYLWGRQEEKRIMRKVLERLKSSRLSVKVSFGVVGELINNLMKKVDPENRGEILSEFLSFQRKFDVDLVPPSKLAYSIANELFEKDEFLKPTDVLIVSQALSDTWSTRLLTTDKDLINSVAIRKFEEDMRKKRKQRLKITAEF